MEVSVRVGAFIPAEETQRQRKLCCKEEKNNNLRKKKSKFRNDFYSETSSSPPSVSTQQFSSFVLFFNRLEHVWNFSQNLIYLFIFLNNKKINHRKKINKPKTNLQDLLNLEAGEHHGRSLTPLDWRRSGRVLGLKAPNSDFCLSFFPSCSSNFENLNVELSKKKERKKEKPQTEPRRWNWTRTTTKHLQRRKNTIWVSDYLRQIWAKSNWKIKQKHSRRRLIGFFFSTVPL